MKKSIVTGILALAASASGLMAQGAAPAPAAAAGPKQPTPKSQAEVTAIQAMFSAQQAGPDAIIKAADELLTTISEEVNEAAQMDGESEKDDNE